MDAPITIRTPDGKVVGGKLDGEAVDDGLSVPPSQAVSEGSGSGLSDGDGDVDYNEEQLIHWWCRKRLIRFVKKLRTLEAAQAFLEPIPWEELGLSDYPEIVKEPIDLKTVGEKLETGYYHDQDGLIDPDIFFGDIALIWDNCQLYYEGDETAEPYVMAGEMREDAEEMEDVFWAELEEFEASLATDGQNVAAVTVVADVAAGQVEDLMEKLNNWWWGGQDGNGANWKIPQVQEREVKKTVIETVAGKGHIKIVMTAVVPSQPADREALISDTIDSLATSLGVGSENIEVDWDHIWKEADLHKYDSNDAAKHQLDIPYCVRLDDAKVVEQVVEEFNAARTKRCLQENLGAGVTITVSEMTISKTSRRPLGDHFFDVIQEKCDYDASRELLEIEDDLCDALRLVLEQIQQIDDEEKDHKELPFPEAHLKKALHDLKRPAAMLGGSTTPKRSQSKSGSRAGSRRGSVVKGVNSSRSPSKKDRNSQLKDGTTTPRAAEPKERRRGSALSGRGTVTKLVATSSDEDDQAQHKFQTQVSLKNIYKKRESKGDGIRIPS